MSFDRQIDLAPLLKAIEDLREVLKPTCAPFRIMITSASFNELYLVRSTDGAIMMTNSVGDKVGLQAIFASPMRLYLQASRCRDGKGCGLAKTGPNFKAELF